VGFQWNKVAKKGMYVDGHEREDVVKYRQGVYIPKLLDYKKRADIHLYDPVTGSWSVRNASLSPGQKRVVFVNQDETLFYSADGLRGAWEETNRPQIRTKSKGDRCSAALLLANSADPRRAAFTSALLSTRRAMC
jgi:hypothetical protein